MKKVTVILYLFILFTVISCEEQVTEQGDRGYHVQIGDIVPEIEFFFTDSTKVKLTELKGKVVVLQFTASWCSVCRKEMPFLEEEVWQKHRDKDFILIGVDYDEAFDRVVAFKEKMKTTYPMALDPGGEIFQKFSYKNSGVTRNVVIDKTGKIAYLTRLFNREEFDEMKVMIEELVGE